MMTNGDTGSRFNVFLLKFIPLLKKQENKKQESFNAAGCSLSKTIYCILNGGGRNRIGRREKWRKKSREEGEKEKLGVGRIELDGHG